MKLLLTFLLLSPFVNAESVFLTIGNDAINTSTKSISSVSKIYSDSDVSIIEVNEKDIENLSHLMHEKFHRCGGYVHHDSYEEALNSIKREKSNAFAKNFSFTNYTISEESTVKSLIKEVDEFQIRSTILKLSSFNNRYYKSKTGIESQAWIKSHWEKIANGRSDISVDYFKHNAWPQPSVILTVEGESKADEIVVIGGHADSIAGFWGRENARAPGADDNASGIATITEVIRVMVKNNYRPAKTIKFMAYAAEEVGLRGSKEIAQSFKRAGKNVVGVMQLDMTNHKGSKDLDIVFVDDYTNKAKNEFLGKVVDKYVHVAWGYTSCGYACSDHASWTNQGYAASAPFESTKEDINREIHTRRDVIDAFGSNGTADHAEKFAKLAVSYLVELGK